MAICIAKVKAKAALASVADSLCNLGISEIVVLNCGDKLFMIRFECNLQLLTWINAWDEVEYAHESTTIPAMEPPRRVA